MKKIILPLVIWVSVVSLSAQSFNTQRIADWNSIWKNGFYESTGNVLNSPNVNSWLWGINIGYANNTESNRENCQILIDDDPGASNLYFRNTSANGAGTWNKVIKDKGNQTIKGELTVEGAATSIVSRITDWNNIWKTGFYESTDNALNSPNKSRFCWGINVGYCNNNQSNRENCQIIIIDEPLTPSLYFRNTNQSGVGNWAKVIHDLGDQKIKGNLAVAGTINAREVNVIINAGADHVFHADYDLKDLSEVEAYVDANKHLPGIPSEKEMQENGLNVNEFQIKLLQKIEELTLYNIQQQKNIELMRKEIEELKGKIEQ